MDIWVLRHIVYTCGSYRFVVAKMKWLMHNLAMFFIVALGCSLELVRSVSLGIYYDGFVLLCLIFYVYIYIYMQLFTMVHNLTVLSFAVYWLRILWHLYTVFLLSHMFVISVFISYSIQSCKVTVIVLWPDCHKSYWTQCCWKYQEKPEISCSTIWFGGSGIIYIYLFIYT